MPKAKEDPHGDKAWLAAKRRKPKAATLDARLPPPTGSTLPAPAATVEPPRIYTSKLIRYVPLTGDAFKLPERMLGLAQLVAIKCKHLEIAAKTVGYSLRSLDWVTNDSRYVDAHDDMLLRRKRGLHARAIAAQEDILDQRGDLKTLATVAADVRDREEGKAQQRVTIESTHIETVRFVVEAGPAPAQLEALDMVKDPRTGRYIAVPQRAAGNTGERDPETP